MVYGRAREQRTRQQQRQTRLPFTPPAAVDVEGFFMPVGGSSPA